MTGKKSLKRLPVVLLTLVFCVCLLVPFVNATSLGSLTLSYEQEGVRFDIYHVAVLNNGTYELTGAFAQYSVDLSAKDWTDTAVTLEAYTQLDSVAPDRSGSISGGSVTFAGLEKGLYLVVGENTISGGYCFMPASFLIYVEGDVTSVVKYEETSTGTTTVSLVVKKVWSGDTKSARPSSVTIQLMKDGEKYNTKTLRASNGWSYTWNELDASANWQIAETKVADNYTVSVSQNGYSFTVTNTYQTKTSATPSGTTGKTTDTTTSSSGTKLPQTGQLWWPVILLATAGLILLAVGLLWTKKKKR